MYGLFKTKNVISTISSITPLTQERFSLEDILTKR